MTWTHEPPKEPGWYWYREDEGTGSVVKWGAARTYYAYMEKKYTPVPWRQWWPVPIPVPPTEEVTPDES